MKIGEILRAKQPDVYRQLNSRKKERRSKDSLSFNYCKELMEEGHVYKRHKRAVRQVK